MLSMARPTRAAFRDSFSGLGVYCEHLYHSGVVMKDLKTYMH